MEVLISIISSICICSEYNFINFKTKSQNVKIQIVYHGIHIFDEKSQLLITYLEDAAKPGASSRVPSPLHSPSMIAS